MAAHRAVWHRCLRGARADESDAGARSRRTRIIGAQPRPGSQKLKNILLTSNGSHNPRRLGRAGSQAERRDSLTDTSERRGSSRKPAEVCVCCSGEIMVSPSAGFRDGSSAIERRVGTTRPPSPFLLLGMGHSLDPAIVPGFFWRNWY